MSLSVTSTSEPPRATRKRPLAQLLFCRGCCCGRVDRGYPDVPVDRIKAVWKAEKLNRTIQLTISGCLGPCDMANVAAIVSSGTQEWFGGLAEPDHFDALIDWARQCHREQSLLPRPASLAPFQFEAFATESAAADQNLLRAP